ncbi:helix-turn-helix domain-containing protein [Collimonas arenae]|uniref:helix-turn-helix domain-containing protein n=1 Tax=Collimonas arenae TaxID=279058 RepID=UPI00056F91DA|nr:helix-turn-helix transcriptional regulator [Collimonas arenae]
MIYSQRYEALREVLQGVRHSAGLTQAELAQKLGRGQSYVSKIERGERYLDALEFILWCEACGASPGKIIIGI